jgi:hypothetical protein
MNPKASSYEYYGARGISVCSRWDSFENFYADMGDPPEGMSLDRYPDVNGNYEPGNCRWATGEEQARNRRSNHILALDGKAASIAEWAELTGIKQRTIQARIKSGWPTARALGFV